MTISDLISIINVSPQHNCVYHFTDKVNLPSIFSHGLLSKVKLRELGMWPPASTGGNELSQSLDAHRGIDKYVSLCMTKNHGMEFLARGDGRIQNSIYLKIKADVLSLPNVKIALGVANANDTPILPLSDGIDKMDLEVLYTRTDWKDPAIRERLKIVEKYEILIPERVPEALIERTSG